MKTTKKRVKTTDIALGVVTIAACIFALYNLSKTPPPKDNCPKYLTVNSVRSEYNGAWAGTVITLYTDDGSTHIVDNSKYYAGQKVCVDKL